MSTMDINQVLAQMRVMTAQVKAGSAIGPGVDAAEKTSFSQLLKTSVDKVNEAQQHGRAMATAFEQGQEDTSLAEVMVAMQKSSLSFDAMVQVRNKLVEAYKDVMNMPV